MLRRFVAPAGLWALTDQTLVSLGSASTTILLARALPAAEFGVFVLLFGAMLALNTVHASLIAYPLSIQGARATPHALSRFVTAFVALTLLLAATFVLPFAGLTAALSSWRLVPWAVLALVAWQCQETARRALFANLRHLAAIPGDCVAYLGQAALIGILAWRNAVTLRSVFIAILMTSLAGFALQLRSIRPDRTDRRSIARLARVAVRDGRWVLPSNLLGAFIMQGLLWILALKEATSGAANLQALITIVGVVNPVMFGLGNLIAPLMARVPQISTSSARRQLAWTMSQGGVILMPYALLILVAGGRLLSVVYGSSSPYAGLATPLRLLALAYLLVYLAHVANAALFGLEQLQVALVAQVAGAVTLIATGIPLIIVWGVTGAALATLLVHLVRTVISMQALRRTLQPETQRGARLAESA